MTRFKASATDAGAWRDTVHGLLLLPLGTFGFTAAVTAWSTALGLATSPPAPRAPCWRTDPEGGPHGPAAGDLIAGRLAVLGPSPDPGLRSS